jgi:glycine/D-amino acid oxidase-like deaminating enzyme
MKGGCHAYFSQHFFDEAKAETLATQKSDPELGAMVRIIEDKDELAALRVPNAVGVLLQSKAAKLSPYKLVSWLLERAVKESGLNLQTSTPALSIAPSSTEGKWDVKTARGTITTSQILVATNGYTAHLLPELSTLIVPVRGEMSALKAPTEVLDTPLEHTYVFVGSVGQDRAQDDYLVQRPIESGGQLMFGGGRAFAAHEGVNVDSDDSIDPPAAEYLRASLKRYLDVESKGSSKAKLEKGLEAVKEWSGIMGYSRDGRPWVGGLPGKDGIFVAAGYSGHGQLHSSYLVL